MFENGTNQQATATNVNGYGMPNYGNPYYPGMMGTGYNYVPQQPAQQPKQYSTLTPEEIQSLIDKGPGFNLKLTAEEKTRGVCNHRTPDGLHDSLESTEDGSVRCTICGYKFRPVDNQTMSVDDVRCSVEGIVDILQTIKMIYVDLNLQEARDYFQIIPMLEKIPKLYELAIANYGKHEQYNPYKYDGKNMSAARMFDIISSAFNGGVYPQMQQQYQDPYMQQPQYYQQAPQMGNGMPNPAFQQAPVQQPYPTNGFGYYGAAPMQQPYQAQNNGYQYVAGQQQPNVAPVQQPVAQAQAATATPTPVETKTIKS